MSWISHNLECIEGKKRTLLRNDPQSGESLPHQLSFKPLKYTPRFTDRSLHPIAYQIPHDKCSSQTLLEETHWSRPVGLGLGLE